MLGYIHDGRLVASNVSVSSRARWKITARAITDFLHATSTAAKSSQTRKRQPSLPEVDDYV